MQKTIVVELPEFNDRDFTRSAEDALRQAQSYGTITSWHWGEPQGNGQSYGSVEAESLVTRVKNSVADGLEELADALRNEG